jgi:hypothetical protein
MSHEKESVVIGPQSIGGVLIVTPPSSRQSYLLADAFRTMPRVDKRFVFALDDRKLLPYASETLLTAGDVIKADRKGASTPTEAEYAEWAPLVSHFLAILQKDAAKEKKSEAA